MLDMAQINHIRDLGNAGYSISKIHDLTGVDRKTIRKYLGMEDFSPQMPPTTSRPSMLLHKPGSWYNSGVRLEMPDPLREYMDHLERPELKNCLALLADLSRQYAFYPAIDAMNRSLRDGRISASDAKLICERICSYGLDTPPTEGPDLTRYDKAFLPGPEGGDAA